jgi:hypothetical protein
VDVPWDPFEAAEARGVRVATDEVADLLGGAFSAWWHGVQIVVLSPSLRAPDRRAALAHELIHLERGGGIDLPGMPSSWASEVAREEARVDDEVALRLVPLSQLSAAANDADRSVDEVAAELEVPVDLVWRAARLAGLVPSVSDRPGRVAAARSRRGC